MNPAQIEILLEQFTRTAEALDNIDQRLASLEVISDLNSKTLRSIAQRLSTIADWRS
jgi:hypothetical protein